MHGGAGGALVGHLGVQGRIMSGGMSGAPTICSAAVGPCCRSGAGAMEVLSPDQRPS